MAQQTAMQTLWEWIDANYHEESFNLNNARDMSLKLEKEQIIEANEDCSTNELGELLTGEQYYNENYGK
jgi:hypothetical protein